MHGAFHTGEKKTNWGIENVLKSLYNLFDETTARREEYTDITKSDVFPLPICGHSDVFPLPFCGYRCIEDKKVAERTLKIWTNISSFVKETLNYLLFICLENA